MNDDEIIERFILRARRIQSHSMVKDWKALERHANGSITGTLDLTGRLTITRQLPQDEEVFESLVARIRPLTLSTEPVFYTSVLDAIGRALEASPGTTDAMREKYKQLRTAWSSAGELQGTNIQGYSLQSMRLDGTDATNVVSDTQLAAGWLYADLVHADAKGAKKESLSFSLLDRYRAAIQVFSGIAVVTVMTLEFLKQLGDAEVVSPPDSVWNDEVVIEKTELIEESKVFFADVETASPDLRAPGTGLTEDWTELTVTSLLRQDPSNQVRVVLMRGDSILTNYDAAVIHRGQDGSILRWHALIGGSLVLGVEFELDGEAIANISVSELVFSDATNKLKLSSIELQLLMHEATEIRIEIGGLDFLSIEPPNLTPDEVRSLMVVSEVVQDILLIEDLLGAQLAPCNEKFTDVERIRLRRTRLLHEGHLVRANRGTTTVTSTNGAVPKVIVSPPGVLRIGGTEVPTPQTFMRHPAMQALDDSPASDEGGTARRFLISVPNGDRFLAWAPALRQVTDDSELNATADWNLTGIDESTFPV